MDYTRHNEGTQTQICSQPTKDTLTADSLAVNLFTIKMFKSSGQNDFKQSYSMKDKTSAFTEGAKAEFVFGVAPFVHILKESSSLGFFYALLYRF